MARAIPNSLTCHGRLNKVTRGRSTRTFPGNLRMSIYCGYLQTPGGIWLRHDKPSEFRLPSLLESFSLEVTMRNIRYRRCENLKDVEGSRGSIQFPALHLESAP